VEKQRKEHVDLSAKMIRILHLSDMHIGASEQAEYWPTAKKALFEDLARQAGTNGGWDLAVFTGDLTQRGTIEEYSRVTEFLAELWEHLHSIGSAPLFLAVPGNHDLARPDQNKPEVRLLANYALDSSVRDAFWQANYGYRAVVDSAFANYVAWWDSLEHAGVPLAPHVKGALPGDFSSSLHLNDQSLGIVGLNTAWLHLGAGDLKGRLGVESRQLHAVTNEQPNEWATQHRFNLLLTHHPADWLGPQSLSGWNSDIFHPDWFDCHLYGHMHSQSAKTSSAWGSSGRRELQAPSLFSIEPTPDGSERRHGYSTLQVAVQGSQKVLRLWPRIAKRGDNGLIRVVPNHDLELGDGNWTEEAYPDASVNLASNTPLKEPVGGLRTAPEKEVLSVLRQRLNQSPATQGIRAMERREGSAAIRESGVLWLCAEWGMGADEYIRSLQEASSIDPDNSFIIDVHDYNSEDEVLIGVQERVGCTFEQLCEVISLQPPCTVIFDDVVLDEERGGDRRFQREIEKLTGIVRQYCPNASIIIRSKHHPVEPRYTCVELKALDLAETAAYIKLGGASAVLGASQSEYVQRIHQHTDGIPARIDLALRHIQTLGPSVLLALNTDIAGKQAISPTSGAGLEKTMTEFFSSEDPSLRRAAELLVALSMFPKGEQLLTVKRFHEKRPFYDSDAITLSQRGFVDSVDVTDVGHAGHSHKGRAIVVKRSVRDFIYRSLSTQELARLNARALEIYFGPTWRLGEIKGKRALRTDSNQRLDWQIGNASMMLMRAARQAINERDNRAIKHGLALVNAYGSWLREGDNYQSLRALCEDLLPLLSAEDDLERELIPLRMHFARSLRMTGKHEEAKAYYRELIPELATTRDKSSAYLNLALTSKRVGDEEGAILAAKSCIGIDKNSGNALHARTLILEATSEPGPELEAKLMKAEKAARKRKLHTLANNLALKRIADEAKPDAKRDALTEVVKFGAENSDYLNVMRAQVTLGFLKLEQTGGLGATDLVGPIAAFHYFYSEEMGPLLDRSHALLWKAFQAMQETDNLLRLFRHSSILWRLRGREELEERYLKELGPILAQSPHAARPLPPREFLYYKSRSESLSNASPATLESET